MWGCKQRGKVDGEGKHEKATPKKRLNLTEFIEFQMLQFKFRFEICDKSALKIVRSKGKMKNVQEIENRKKRGRNKEQKKQKAGREEKKVPKRKKLRQRLEKHARLPFLYEGHFFKAEV